MPDFKTNVKDHRHCLLSLTLHQAPCSAAHNTEEFLQKLATFSNFPNTQESGHDTLRDLVVLLGHSGEIDEETTTHVWFEVFDLTFICRFETVH